MKAMKLTKITSFSAPCRPWEIVFSSNGNMGLVGERDNCGFVLTQDGKIIKEICNEDRFDFVNSVSYCCGKFGFIDRNGNVYIMDENGSLIKKIWIWYHYNNAVAMRPDGFMACGSECAFFDFDGNKKWEVDVGSSSKPAYYKGYWYIPSGSLIIVKNGRIVNKISYGCNNCNNEEEIDSGPAEVAICGKFLAVSTWYYVHVYDLTNPENPKEIWKDGAFDENNEIPYRVAFSPDCKYLASIAGDGHWLNVYDIATGKILTGSFYSDDYIEDDYDEYWPKDYDYTDYDYSYDWRATAVAWWKDRIAVGHFNDMLTLYQVSFELDSSPR